MVKTIQLLAKKTIRDLTLMLGPALILSTVLAAGLSSMILSQSNLRSLERSQQLTYEKLKFADAAIPLVRIPREAVQRIRSVSGFRQVDCRLSESGQVRLPAEQRQIYARFHSFPEQDSLNQLKIIAGSRPKTDSSNEAMLSDAFARAWKIEQGRVIEVLIKGKSFKFKVAALVRSPEFVYQAGPATSVPDDKLSSIWWINRRILEQTNHLQSACNEILISTSRPDALQYAHPEITAYLKRFGFTHIIERKRMLSHYFLEGEFDQLRGMSVYVPLVFIGVTLFLLHITITRVLLSQRETTGTLRAFGFGKKILIAQAFSLSFGCLLPGFILGTFLGIWGGSKLFDVYTKFYRFAYIEYSPSLGSVALALLICAATTIFGSLQGLYHIFRESPAATLAPEAPPHTRRTMFDSMSFLRHLNILARLSIRNIFRRPFQSSMTLIGLILSTALLLFARFEEKAIVQMMDLEFNDAQRQSHALTFAERLPASVFASVRSALPAGLAEASVVLPVILKIGLYEREMSLIAKSTPETLRQVENIPVRSLAREGVVISKSVAEKTGITLPQRVTIITKERQPKEFSVEVSDFSENLMGSIASISGDLFEKLDRGERTFNMLLFKNERLAEFPSAALFSRFPNLVSVSEKDFERKAFAATIAENINVFRNVMIGFSLLLAMGVLYNNARIQFAEREREFALMRALGFSESDLTLLFWSDYFVLAILAIPAGLWLGRQLVIVIMRAVDTEIFRIPVNIPTQSYFWAAGFLLFGFLLTALLIQPRIRKIAYLSILKTRE
jgi:putative ABC transport system permease protein